MPRDVKYVVKYNEFSLKRYFYFLFTTLLARILIVAIYRFSTIMKAGTIRFPLSSSEEAISLFFFPFLMLSIFGNGSVETRFGTPDLIAFLMSLYCNILLFTYWYYDAHAITFWDLQTWDWLNICILGLFVVGGIFLELIYRVLSHSRLHLTIYITSIATGILTLYGFQYLLFNSSSLVPAYWLTAFILAHMFSSPGIFISICQGAMVAYCIHGTYHTGVYTFYTRHWISPHPINMVSEINPLLTS